MTPYIEVCLSVEAEHQEILVAELAEIGFDSFVENDDSLMAYIPVADFDENKLKEVVVSLTETPISYTSKTLETVNWNEEWERNYQPIEVDDMVRVRASYHSPDPQFKYDIVIDPKMSFGTGHHETTTMMMQFQLTIPHQDSSVLDVGSGTGILAILSEKLGAIQLMAFDIEEWAYLNAIENVQLNGCNYIDVFQGTIEDCPIATYDIILANINRNILLAEIPTYTSFLKQSGILVVSGFYEQDAEDIAAKAQASGLTKTAQKQLNQWVAMTFERA